jgi:hypothetical protein
MATSLGPDELFRRITPIERAVREAARDAVLRHKLMGNAVPDWRDGKTVWVEPRDIVVPADLADPAEKTTAA